MKILIIIFMSVAMFRQSTGHVDSYYAHSLNEAIPQYPTFQGTEHCDVAIVGAGFSGLHTALRLALAGKRVVLLEASKVAWAASGRNGGQAILGWSCDMPPIEKALGHERAKRLWDGMVWASQEIQALPLRHSFDVEYQPGHLWTSVLPRRVTHLHEWQEQAAKKWNYEQLQFVNKQELGEWISSDRYQAGLYDPNGGHLHPLKLSLGLAEAFTLAGGTIYEHTKITHFKHDKNGYTLFASGGHIKADVMVLACNAYIDELDKPVSRKIIPVGNYQVATEQLSPELARSLLPKNCCVTDNQFVLDYFRLTQDNRLLFGGGCTYLGGLPKDVAAATRPFIKRVFPQLANVKIDYAWGGHLDITMKRTPDIGGRDNKYWMQGYSGHGILPTLAAARAVSDAILGNPDELSLYEEIKNPSFPAGELFASSLEAAGKAWYRLRDFI